MRPAFHRWKQRAACSCDVQSTKVRKHGLNGRWYARGPSIQSYLTKATRSVGLANDIGDSAGGDMVFVDIDINNCFLTLFVKVLEDNGADMEEFGIMACFCIHYKAWREFLSEFLGISLKASKKLLIRLVHLGRPAQDIPFLWELSAQIQKAVDFLLALGKFEHLANRFADRPNPRATRLHYALADVEESVMNDVVQSAQGIPNCHINAFMCDGAILRIAEDSKPQLQTELETIGARHGVSFSSCTMDRQGEPLHVEDPQTWIPLPPMSTRT